MKVEVYIPAAYRHLRKSTARRTWAPLSINTSNIRANDKFVTRYTHKETMFIKTMGIMCNSVSIVVPYEKNKQSLTFSKRSMVGRPTEQSASSELSPSDKAPERGSQEKKTCSCSFHLKGKPPPEYQLGIYEQKETKFTSTDPVFDQDDPSSLVHPCDFLVVVHLR